MIRFLLGVLVGALLMLLYLKRDAISAAWRNRDKISAGLDFLDHGGQALDDLGRVFK